MKDWTGDANSVFKTLGSSHHTEEEREENDFYATDPGAVVALLGLEKFSPKIWECACGQGHLSKEIEFAGYQTRSSDLIDRGYGKSGVNFLSDKITHWDGDIITNPPYKYAKEFILKALSIIPDGKKVAMFLKVQFLEGKSRKDLFKTYPPRTVYVSSSRIMCAQNGFFDGKQSSAVAYAWFVWEKGYSGYTVLKWFN
jgi:hypothetical protein